MWELHVTDTRIGNSQTDNEILIVTIFYKQTMSCQINLSLYLLIAVLQQNFHAWNNCSVWKSPLTADAWKYILEPLKYF